MWSPPEIMGVRVIREMVAADIGLGETIAPFLELDVDIPTDTPWEDDVCTCGCQDTVWR